MKEIEVLMDEQKIPQKTPEHGEEPEEYSFLQEVIKDEAGNSTRVKHNIWRMAGYGLVFGIVASFSFCVLKPLIESKFMSNPKQVTIPRDEEEEEPAGEQTEPVSEELSEEERYSQAVQSLNQVAEQTGKSVVEITGLTGEEVSGTVQRGHSISGMVVADNGQELLILGRTLPAKDAKSIQVTFADGSSYGAVEKKRDNNLGFSVYAVRRDELKTETWAKCEKAKLGSSNRAAAGETVIVLGKPMGVDPAVSYGLLVSGDSYREVSDGIFRLLFTDVAGAAEGSGVIANTKGEIIGIVAQETAEEGNEGRIVGYGISDMKDIMELLSNGEDVPYVGICGVDVSQAMESRGLPKGVYVKEIEPDSPAMAAGIQSGDIITEIDGTESTSFAVYHSMLMKEKPEDRIHLKGKRQGAGEEYVDIDFDITVGVKK